jgi:hemoglobin
MSFPTAYGVGDASYQAAGGIDGLQRLVDDFYTQMEQRPEAAAIRAMHPASLAAARDKLSCFLSGWLGGPPLFSERYGSISIPAFHAQWPIKPAHSQAWLDCMAAAIARQPYPADFAEYLLAQLRVPANRIVQASHSRHGA